MKIASFRLYRFKLRLHRPLKLKDTAIDSREGFLTEVRDYSGNAAYGEASPLPSFSRETITQAQKQLKSIGKAILKAELPSDLEKLDGGFERWLDQWSLAPSVRFAIETTVLNLMASDRRCLLPDLFGSPSDAAVNVNALLTGDKEEIFSKAVERVREGYRCLKVKISGLAPGDAADVVCGVRDQAGKGVALRVDANRSFTIGDALDLFGRIAECDVEYVEEPVHNLNQLRKLLAEKSRTVGVALDESLLEIQPEDLSRPYRIRAVVIKPTLIGLEKAVIFARKAVENGITPVISSSFESSVGMSVLAALASTMAGDIAAGLDTPGWLAEDLTASPVRVVNGKIDREFYCGDMTIKPDLLEEIPIE